MKSTWEAMSQLAALHRTRGPFMQGRGCPGSAARLGASQCSKAGLHIIVTQVERGVLACPRSAPA